MNHNKRGVLTRLKTLVNSHSQVHFYFGWDNFSNTLWPLKSLSKPTLSALNLLMQGFHSPAPKRPKQDPSSTENDLDYSVCRGKITASTFYLFICLVLLCFCLRFHVVWIYSSHRAIDVVRQNAQKHTFVTLIISDTECMLLPRISFQTWLGLFG